MTPRPTLVLLPGMDGTGDLFAPFVEALGAQAQVVRYPGDLATGYAALTDLARAALPKHGEYWLLGESFSGPIAVTLAAEKPPGLLGLVLCCTFVRNPRPALAAAGRLLGMMPAIAPPLAPLNALLLGRDATPARRDAFREVMGKVRPEVMRARLQAVLAVDVSAQLRAVDVPILYLRATDDRVVPPSASELVAAIRPDVRVVQLPGPHFLLQVNAQGAAEAVERFKSDTQAQHRATSNPER